MSPLKDVITKVRGLSPRSSKLIIAGVVVVLVAAVAVPLVVQLSSIGSLHGYEPSEKTLMKSVHAEVPCYECHVDRRGPVVFGASLVGEFYRGLFIDKTPAFVKMHKPDNEACIECHERAWSDDSKRTMRIPHPAHLRVATEERECVLCHKWTGHQEEYLEKHKTMPFSGVCVAYECHVGTKQLDECESCHHSLEEKPGEFKQGHPELVFNTGAGGCLEACHQVKQCQDCHIAEKPLASGDASGTTERKEIEALHIKSNWLQAHGTWALPDQSKCLTCHVSEGECQNCHTRRPASHGPTDTWIGTHANAAKDKRRCVTCHEQAMCDDCHDQFKEMR